MANTILLYSSIVFGSFHIFSCIVWYNNRYIPLYLYYNTGVITSIMNHAVTNYRWRIMDRGVMSSGAFIDIYTIHNFVNVNSVIYKQILYIGIMFSIMLYLLQKYKINDNDTIHIYHILCHFLITITHITIVYCI